MNTEISHSMMDNSIRSQTEIAKLLKDAERHLKALERIESILGPLRIDAESVRLQLKDYERHYVDMAY